MDRKTTLQCSAEHEVLHALLLGQVPGAVIEAVRLSPPEVIARLPFQPEALRQRFFRFPQTTMRELRRVVGAIIGPSLLLGEPMQREDGDAALLDAWQQGWEHARGVADRAPSWTWIVHGARAFVRRWYAEPGRHAQVTALTTELLRRHVVTDWNALVQAYARPRPALPLTVPLKPEHVPCASSWRDLAYYDVGSIPFVLS
jgi:hypothetical protein